MASLKGVTEVNDNQWLFNGIKTTGSGMVSITKEGICHTTSECVNLRLKRLYVEVSGEGLFEHQNIIRVEVTHSGQNLFYLPPDGKTTASYVQTKSKLVHINVDKTKLSSNECNNKGCKRTRLGKEYRGTLSETKGGYTCQAWNSQTPHFHKNSPQKRPNAGLVKNYCRNPDDSWEGPWCYTTSRKKRWEYCDVKMCASYCIASLPDHRNVRDMCTLNARTPAEELYGTEPCRSLFTEYTISLPKVRADHPSNRGTATKNSKLLDWTKVKKIKFFASVRAYKNYPTMAECAHVRGCGLK